MEEYRKAKSDYDRSLENKAMLTEEIRGKMVERADLVGQQEELEMLVDELAKSLTSTIEHFKTLDQEYNSYIQTRRLYYDSSRKTDSNNPKSLEDRSSSPMKSNEYCVMFDKDQDLQLLHQEFKKTTDDLLEQMKVPDEETLRVLGDYLEVQDKLGLIDAKLYKNTEYVEKELEPKSRQISSKVQEAKSELDNKNSVMLQLVEQQDKLDREGHCLSRKPSTDGDPYKLDEMEPNIREHYFERDQIISDLDTFMKQKEALLKRKNCLRDELAKLLEHKKLMQAVEKVNEKKLNLQYLLREKRGLEIELWKFETELVDGNLSHANAIRRSRFIDYPNAEYEETRTLSQPFGSSKPLPSSISIKAQQNTFNSFLECLSRQSHGLADYPVSKDDYRLEEAHNFQDVSRISAALSNSRIKTQQPRLGEHYAFNEHGDLLSLHDHFAKHGSLAVNHRPHPQLNHRPRQSNFSDITNDNSLKSQLAADGRISEGMYHQSSQMHKREGSRLSDIQQARRTTEISLPYQNDEYSANKLLGRRSNSPLTAGGIQSASIRSDGKKSEQSRVKGLEQLLMGSTKRKGEKGTYSDPMIPTLFDHAISEPQHQDSLAQHYTSLHSRPKHFSLINPSQLLLKPLSNKYIGPASPTLGDIPLGIKNAQQYSSLREPVHLERSQYSQLSSIIQEQNTKGQRQVPLGSYTPQKSDYARTQPYMKFGVSSSRDSSLKLNKSKVLGTNNNLLDQSGGQKENEGSSQHQQSDSTYLAEFLNQTRRKHLQTKVVNQNTSARSQKQGGSVTGSPSGNSNFSKMRLGDHPRNLQGKLTPTGSRSRSPLNMHPNSRQTSVGRTNTNPQSMLPAKSSETLICPYFSTEQTSRSHSEDNQPAKVEFGGPQQRNVLYGGFREAADPVLHKTPTESSIQKQSSGSQFHSLQNNQEYNSLLFGTEDRSADLTLHSHSKSYASGMRGVQQGQAQLSSANKFEGLKMNSNFRVFKRGAHPKQPMPVFSPFTYSSLTPQQAGYFECEVYYESGFFAFFPTERTQSQEEENIFKVAHSDEAEDEDIKIDVLDILEVHVPQTTLDFARKRQIGNFGAKHECYPLTLFFKDDTDEESSSAPNAQRRVDLILTSLSDYTNFVLLKKKLENYPI